MRRLGSLTVNITEAQASIKVGRDLPIALDEISSNTHDVRKVPGFRPRGPAVTDPLKLRSQLPRGIEGPPTSSICHRTEAIIGTRCI